MRTHANGVPGLVRRRVLAYTDRKRRELLERPSSPERERDLRFVGELEAAVMGPMTALVRGALADGASLGGTKQ